MNCVVGIIILITVRLNVRTFSVLTISDCKSTLMFPSEMSFWFEIIFLEI